MNIMSVTDIDANMAFGSGQPEKHQITGAQGIQKGIFSEPDLMCSGSRQTFCNPVGKAIMLDSLHERRTIHSKPRVPAHFILNDLPSHELGQ